MLSTSICREAECLCSWGSRGTSNCLSPAVWHDSINFSFFSIHCPEDRRSLCHFQYCAHVAYSLFVPSYNLLKYSGVFRGDKDKYHYLYSLYDYVNYFAGIIIFFVFLIHFILSWFFGVSLFQLFLIEHAAMPKNLLTLLVFFNVTSTFLIDYRVVLIEWIRVWIRCSTEQYCIKVYQINFSRTKLGRCYCG